MEIDAPRVFFFQFWCVYDLFERTGPTVPGGKITIALLLRCFEAKSSRFTVQVHLEWSRSALSPRLPFDHSKSSVDLVA